MDRIAVNIAFSGTPVRVGELAMLGGKVYFKFDTNFPSRELDLSPVKLKHTKDPQRPDTEVLDGLFGVFADSLPDGWGRLTLDRALTERGILLADVTVLDRLAYVGKNGFGALTYHPVKEGLTEVSGELDLDVIAQAATAILNGDSTDVLDKLVQLGGSSGGARPKITVGYNPVTGQMTSNTGKLADGFEHWLIKYPATLDPKDIARTEMAYHKMALAAGLEMMPCRLLAGKSGNVYFATKRFDRVGNDRLHLHSAAGLMHDNFRFTNVDYGHVMDAANKLEKDNSAAQKVLRLAAFNVFAHNRDDHSKNISFLMDSSGKWRLAPAYDLTFSQSTHGYHSMTVAGQSRAPGVKELAELASQFKIEAPEDIIEEVRQAINRWSEFAEKTGVPTATRKRIGKILNP